MLLAAEASDNFVELDVPSWAWVVLGVIVVALLGIDLWRHRVPHEATLREAATESAFWVACGMAFAVFFLVQFGAPATGEYLGVYITEKALSVDNVFVWSLLFTTMKIPRKYQHSVLFWGVFGALVFRSIFIFIGSAIIERFSWVLVFFGLFLIFTGFKIIRHDDNEGEETSTAGLGLLRRIMPVTDTIDGPGFFTQLNGKRAATPLFAALVVVEFTDIVFAVDSVPASFGVANEPYTIIAANAFAIMGLRAMYALLADARERFHYLSHALGGILLFVGVKLAIVPWYHIPIGISLGVIVVILIAAVYFSLWKAKQIAAEAAKR